METVETTIQTESTHEKWWKARTQNIAALFVLVSFFIYLVLLVFVGIPPENKDIVNFLSGTYFGTATTGVTMFLWNYVKRKDDDKVTVTNEVQ